MDLSDWLRVFDARDWPPEPEPVLLTALLLVAGALAGEFIARMTRLPRVVGYTGAGFVAAGVGIGFAVPLAGTSRLIVDVALALMLFDIGSRVRLRWLRFNPPLLWTSLAEAIVGGVAVFFVLEWLGIEPRVAAACAVLSMPASAAVAGRVAHELGAEGQVTDRMILLTALNTLYAVLAMTLLRGWLESERAVDLVATAAAFGYSFVGSLLLSAVLALLVAAAARKLDLRNESSVLLVLGLVVLAISTARLLGLSTLLVPLLAGLVLRNSTQRPWVWPRHFGTAGGVLVLMLFVIVGASWSPQLLAAGGVAALAMVLVRGLAKGSIVLLFASWAGISSRQGLALAVTLTPLSATALVMLSELHAAVPHVGMVAAPIMLSAVAVLELIGPIAVQAALSLADERTLGVASRKPEVR